MDIDEKEFNLIRQYIRKHFGIKLGVEKKNLVISRLGNLIKDMGMSNFTEYYNYLVDDTTNKASYEFIDKMTTNHTFFMREPDHFLFLESKVLPWIKSNSRDRDIRIWSAGCSTGQEPYTIAMIIEDFLGKEKKLWDADVLATDISSSALEEAKKGVYTEKEIKALPSKWIKKYFSRGKDGNFIASQDLKKGLVIRKLNLLDNHFNFKRKFHVIFCKNVMIYFDEDTRRCLLEKFYMNLEYGGYLFIGKTESLGGLEGRFRYLEPSIYRKE